MFTVAGTVISLHHLKKKNSNDLKFIRLSTTRSDGPDLKRSIFFLRDDTFRVKICLSMCAFQSKQRKDRKNEPRLCSTVVEVIFLSNVGPARTLLLVIYMLCWEDDLILSQKWVNSCKDVGGRQIGSQVQEEKSGVYREGVCVCL